MEDEVILAELPDEFGTRDYIAKLQTKTNATDRTGANRLNALIRDGRIQKVGPELRRITSRRGL